MNFTAPWCEKIASEVCCECYQNPEVSVGITPLLQE